MSDTDTANEEQPLQVQDDSKTDVVNQPRQSVFDDKETIYVNNIKGHASSRGFLYREK